MIMIMVIVVMMMMMLMMITTTTLLNRISYCLVIKGNQESVECGFGDWHMCGYYSSTVGKLSWTWLQSDKSSSNGW